MRKILIFSTCFFIFSGYCLGYKIGYIGPLSGDLSDYGEEVRQGLELAINEYLSLSQEVPKLVITLETEDSKGEDDAAVSAYNRFLADRDCIAVVGPFLSSSVVAISKVVDRDVPAVITPTASMENFLNLSSNIFRTSFVSEVEGSLTAEYIIKEKKIKKIGIFHSNSAESKRLTNAFTKRINELGGTIVTVQSYEGNTADFKEQMMAMGGVDQSKVKGLDEADEKRLKQKIEDVGAKVLKKISGGEDIKKKIAIWKFTTIISDESEKYRLGDASYRTLSYFLAKDDNLDVMEWEDFKKSVEENCIEIPKNFTSETASKIGKDLELDNILWGEVIEKKALTFEIKVHILDVVNETVYTYGCTYQKSKYPASSGTGIEAVYLPVDSNDAALIIPQFKFYDIDILLVGTRNWIDENLLKYCGSALRGALIPAEFFEKSEDPKVKKFIQSFSEQYLVKPGSFAAYGYDIGSLIIQQLHKGKFSRKEIMAALRETKDFSGVTGFKGFNPDRTPVYKLFFVTVKDNEFTEIQPENK